MKHIPSAHRGSALMLAVILSAVIAVITASYLRMATNESKFSYTAFLRNGALNLAEAGAEEAIWALNNDDFSGWTTDASGLFVYKKAQGFDYDQAKSTTIQMIIVDPSGDPLVLSRGIIELPGGREMDKIIRIELIPRQVAPNGLTAKDSITFSGGNVGFDAYDSKSTSIIRSIEDQGTVATTSILNDAVNVSNSSVMGGVATGGGTVDMGPNARVFDEGDVNDYGSPALIPNGYVNPDLVTNDFRADFPVMEAPSGGSYQGTINSNTTLNSGVYVVDKIQLNNKQLTINGDVTLVVKGDVSVGGNSGAININQATGSLKMYVAGDMAVAGNGIVNVAGLYTPTPAGQFGVSPALGGAYPKPMNLMIFGTAPASSNQSLSYSGNAALAGVIYAPDAAVALNGGGNGGELLGAIVAKTIKVTGGYQFHYDVQLKNLFFEEDSYRMESWNELITAVDKNKFRAAFDSL